MDLDNQILREARKYLALSQLEVAALLGVSLITYQRWEQGKTTPQPFHRRKILTTFEKAWGGLNVPLLLIQEERVEQPCGDGDESNPQCQSSTSQNDDTSASFRVSPMSTFPPLEISSENRAETLIDEPEVFIASHMITHLWSLAFKDHLTSDDKQRAVRQAIKDFDIMNTNDKNYQMTRREALCSLATLPMVTLGLSTAEKAVPPAQYASMLAYCAGGLEALNELYLSSDASDTLLAFKSASKYLPILKTIASETTQYRKEALNLASQYSLLKTLLGWICMGSTETIQYAKDAVVLSKGTGDISLQLSAYSKLAWAYFFDKKYILALSTAQEAESRLLQHDRLPNSQPLHPLVQGGTYSTLALMQSTNRHSPDVALGKASETESKDTSYAFINSKPSTLLLEAGWANYYYGNQAKAMATLVQRVDPDTLVPKMSQSAMGRVETINVMTLSSLKSKNRDMEQTIYFWVAGIEGAKTLKNEQRFNEAQTAYELMEVVWPDEVRIKDLRDYLVHW